MSTEKEETSWGSTAILLVAGLVVVGLVWRSYLNDAPRVTTYQAPPARSAPPNAAAPQIETAQSLSALAESHFSARRYAEAISVYRKMLARDPKDAATYNELGLASTHQEVEELDALRKARPWAAAKGLAELRVRAESMGREKPAGRRGKGHRFGPRHRSGHRSREHAQR